MSVHHRFDKIVRRYIFKTFAETTLPPTTKQIAHHFFVSIASVEEALERLAESHSIVLAPGTHTIWMAHPFSGLPTNYLTLIGTQKFYANCAWNMLGISSFLKRDAKVLTPCGCGECNEFLDLWVLHKKEPKSDWLFHFPVPPHHFRNEIGVTWVIIRAFSSKAHLSRWVTRRGVSAGYTLSVKTCWELSQRNRYHDSN